MAGPYQSQIYPSEDAKIRLAEGGEREMERERERERSILIASVTRRAILVLFVHTVQRWGGRGADDRGWREKVREREIGRAHV